MVKQGVTALRMGDRHAGWRAKRANVGGLPERALPGSGTGERALPGAVEPAIVAALLDGGAAVLVRQDDEPSTPTVRAELALAAPYDPTVGDRVLVANGGTDRYVIGVLRAAAPAALRLPDGAEVRRVGDRAELRNAEGELLVRYERGTAWVAAPSGDLHLEAPRGRILLRSATDVAIEAGRDVRQHAARSAETLVGAQGEPPQLRIGPTVTSLETPRLTVQTQSSELTTGEGRVRAQSLAIAATVLTQAAERFEVTATRLVETAKDAFREVSGLAQSRIGRARTVVEDVYALYSRRTALTSKEDTTIDGRKILLG